MRTIESIWTDEFVRLPRKMKKRIKKAGYTVDGYAYPRYKGVHLSVVHKNEYYSQWAPISWFK